MSKIINLAALTLALMPLSVGCQPTTKPSTTVENSSHVEVTTYSEAVAQLSKFRDEIKVAFDNGAPDGAHDALHEIGEVIEALPALAAKQGDVDQAAAADIKGAQKTLMDAFGKLDGVLHGGEAIEYSSIGPDIQTALDTLKEHVK